MIRTRVGYAGGTTPSPTYRAIGDHSETIQIDYDPAVLTYEELLAIFWEAHNPIYPANSRQYASILHVHDEEQRALAEKSLQAQEKARGATIHTEIVPLGAFTLAEDYHQKYYLQNQPALMAEFEDLYPDFEDFINSTAAARVNGYVGYNGSLEMLQAEKDLLGLSNEAIQTLEEYLQ